MKQILQIFFGVFRNGDDLFCLIYSAFQCHMVSQAVQRRGHFFAGEKGEREIVNRYDGWTAVKNRGVEVGEVHQVQFGFVEQVLECGLLAQ